MSGSKEKTLLKSLVIPVKNRLSELHVDEKYKKSCPLVFSGQVRHPFFMNKPAFYELVFASKLETANTKIPRLGIRKSTPVH